MKLNELVELVVHGFELAGVLVLVVGALAAITSALLTARRTGTTVRYDQVRRGLGRVILLGLELLIIADIVLTITVDTTLRSAVALGLVVVVRTFLSFSLEVELEGTLPWRKVHNAPRPQADAATLPHGKLRT